MKSGETCHLKSQWFHTTTSVGLSWTDYAIASYNRDIEEICSLELYDLYRSAAIWEGGTWVYGRSIRIYRLERVFWQTFAKTEILISIFVWLDMASYPSILGGFLEPGKQWFGDPESLFRYLPLLQLKSLFCNMGFDVSIYPCRGDAINCTRWSEMKIGIFLCLTSFPK